MECEVQLILRGLVRRIEAERLAVVDDCPGPVEDSIIGNTTVEIGIRITWVERDGAVAIGQCPRVVAVRAIGDAAALVGGRALRIERYGARAVGDGSWRGAPGRRARDALLERGGGRRRLRQSGDGRARRERPGRPP